MLTVTFQRMITIRLSLVVTVRKSLKTWVDFLTACKERGRSNVTQSCAMGSPSEMDAPSEIFFFLFDAIPGCLIQSPYDFVLLCLSRLKV